MKHGIQPCLEGDYTTEVHPKYIDKVIQKHIENIESFSFVTKHSHKMKDFGLLKASDPGRLNEHDIFIYGV